MCDHLEYVIENGNKWCVDCGTALGKPFEIEYCNDCAITNKENNLCNQHYDILEKE